VGFLRPLSKMSTPPRVGGSISKLVGLRDFVPNLVGLSNPTILSSKFSGIKQSDHSEHPQISGNKCNFLSWVWRSAQALLGFFFACGGLKIIQSKLSKPPTVFCYFLADMAHRYTNHFFWSEIDFANNIIIRESEKPVCLHKFSHLISSIKS
jgi:hypothetical protein